METHIMPSQHCPSCGHHMDATTDPSGNAHSPQPGDVSLCFYCGDLSWFGSNLMLKAMTPEESIEIMNELPRNTLNLINACKRKYLQAKAHLN